MPCSWDRDLPFSSDFLNYSLPAYSTLAPSTSLWFLEHSKHASTIRIRTYVSFCTDSLLCVSTWLLTSPSISRGLFVIFLGGLFLSDLKLKTRLSLYSLSSLLDWCFIYNIAPLISNILYVLLILSLYIIQSLTLI